MTLMTLLRPVSTPADRTGASVTACLGASARATKPCPHTATLVVTFRAPLSKDETIDYEVRMCDKHGKPKRVGAKVGRAKVVRKRRL